MNTQITAADLRAEIARHGLFIYRVGYRAKLHPMTIGRFLNERRPLTQRYAKRIWRAIQEEASNDTKTATPAPSHG